MDSDNSSHEEANQYEALGMGSDESDSADYQPIGTETTGPDLDQIMFQEEWRQSEGIPTTSEQINALTRMAYDRFDQKYREEVELEIRKNSTTKGSAELEDLHKIITQLSLADPNSTPNALPLLSAFTIPEIESKPQHNSP